MEIKIDDGQTNRKGESFPNIDSGPQTTFLKKTLLSMLVLG